MGFMADNIPSQSPKTQRGFVSDEQANAQGATAGDRLQAVNSGLRQGAAYLSTLPADALLNTENLARAGGGYLSSLLHGGTTEEPQRTQGGLYHYLTPEGIERFSQSPPPTGARPVTQTHAPIPSWADPANDPTLRPNAAGAAIAGLMDQSPTFTTQAARPDDAISRYLHAGASVVPGALAGGGGSIGTTARALTTGAAGAGASQAVHDLHPFQNDTAQALLEAGTGLVVGGGTNKLRGGAPLANETNAGVDAARRQGLLVPSYATNPNPTTSVISRVAKYGTVLDKAEQHNQPITNQVARQDLGLPVSSDPIPSSAISDIRTTENANYRAAAQYPGPILKDQQYYDQLAAARGRLPQGQLAQVLANRKAGRVLDRLTSDQQQVGPNTFDASGGVSDVGALRDAAYQASTAGDRNTAAIYHQAADAVEGAMDRTMGTNTAQSGLVEAWRNARSRLATAHTVENSLDEEGNVQARKLGAQLESGATLGPNMRDVAQASNAAKGKGFGVPGEANPRGGFLGEFVGSSIIGGVPSALHSLGTGDPSILGAGALGTAATFGGVKLAQALARQIALRGGQYQRNSAPGLAEGWLPAGDIGLAGSLR